MKNFLILNITVVVMALALGALSRYLGFEAATIGALSLLISALVVSSVIRL